MEQKPSSIELESSKGLLSNNVRTNTVVTGDNPKQFFQKYKVWFGVACGVVTALILILAVFIMSSTSNDKTTTTPLPTTISTTTTTTTSTTTTPEPSRKKYKLYIVADIKKKRSLRNSRSLNLEEIKNQKIDPTRKIPVSLVPKFTGPNLNMKKIHQVSFVNEEHIFYTRDEYNLFSSLHGPLRSDLWNGDIKNFNYCPHSGRLVVCTGADVYSLNFKGFDGKDVPALMSKIEKLGDSHEDADYKITQCPTTGEIFRLDTYLETVEKWNESSESSAGSWSMLENSDFGGVTSIVCTQNYMWGLIDDTPNKLVVSKRRKDPKTNWTEDDLKKMYEIKNPSTATKSVYGEPFGCTDSDNLVFAGGSATEGLKGYFFNTGVVNRTKFTSTDVTDAEARIVELNFEDEKDKAVPISIISCLNVDEAA